VERRRIPLGGDLNFDVPQPNEVTWARGRLPDRTYLNATFQREAATKAVDRLE
jgi:hypothetical protein